MRSVNRHLAAAVRRGTATASRQAFREAFQQRQEKTLWGQQTGYFRAHRLWEAGNQRRASEIITTNYLATPELTKTERLRAEAVRESLLGFSNLEMIYFAQCVERAVEYRLQTNPEKPQKDILQKLKGALTRKLRGA